MKKASLFLFASLFTLFSCSLFSKDEDGDSYTDDTVLSENADAVQTESASALEQTVTFSGTVSLGNALPRTVLPSADASAADSGANSRSALPLLPSGLHYYFVATPDSGSVYTEDPLLITEENTFSVPLTIGKTWSLEVGLKNADGVIFMKDNFSVLLTVTEPVTTHFFMLMPTKDGTGSISLNMSVPSSVIGLVAECADAAWSGLSVSVDSGNATIETGAGGIKSGIYEVALNFYDANNVLVYATVQTINVFDHMTTDTWRDIGIPGVVVENGACTITDAALAQFVRTTFYVGDTPVVAPGTASDALGDGSAYKPFATLSRAVAVVVSNGSADSDYMFRISGAVAGATTLPDTLTDKAKSITICGANGLASDGTPQDALTLASGEAGSVLTVESAVPLTIRSVKITGGNAANGGGIYSTASGASITLSGAAAVSENTATAYGGGIYATNAATILIKDNACISSNTAASRAGGMYLTGAATVEMTGGEISGNKTATWGGGVVLNGGATFTMSAGSVNGNKVTQVSAASKTCAGGFFVEEDCMLTVSGTATISENESPFDGGGVRVQRGAALIMTGGTICNNFVTEADAKGGAVFVEKNGATFKMSGDAYIPYGVATALGTIEKGAGKNDVGCEDTSALVTVAGELTHEGAVATITPYEYRASDTVIVADAGAAVVLADENDKFEVTQPADKTDLFYVTDEGALASIFDFTNGKISGSETKDGTPYEIVNYSYLVYDNLQMRVDNYFEAQKGYTAVYSVDGTAQSGGSALTLNDGYCTMNATLTKAGCETITVTKNISVKIKPVKAYISTQLHGWYALSEKQLPFAAQTFYVQAKNAGIESTAATFTHDYSSYAGTFRDGANACNYYWSTPQDKNYVLLTEKDSVFYFYADAAYDYNTCSRLGKINKGDESTTRTLASMRNGSTSFVCTARNSSGEAAASGNRSTIRFDVRLSDTAAFAFTPERTEYVDANGFAIIEVESASSTVDYALNAESETDVAVEDSGSVISPSGTLSLGEHTLTATVDGLTVTEKVKVVQKLASPAFEFGKEPNEYPKTVTTELKDKSGNVVGENSYDIEYIEVKEDAPTVSYSVTSESGTALTLLNVEAASGTTLPASGSLPVGNYTLVATVSKENYTPVTFVKYIQVVKELQMPKINMNGNETGTKTNSDTIYDVTEYSYLTYENLTYEINNDANADSVVTVKIDGTECALSGTLEDGFHSFELTVTKENQGAKTFTKDMYVKIKRVYVTVGKISAYNTDGGDHVDLCGSLYSGSDASGPVTLASFSKTKVSKYHDVWPWGHTIYLDTKESQYFHFWTDEMEDYDKSSKNDKLGIVSYGNIKRNLKDLKSNKHFDVNSSNAGRSRYSFDVSLSELPQASITFEPSLTGYVDSEMYESIEVEAVGDTVSYEISTSETGVALSGTVDGVTFTGEKTGTLDSGKHTITVKSSKDGKETEVTKKIIVVQALKKPTLRIWNGTSNVTADSAGAEDAAYSDYPCYNVNLTVGGTLGTVEYAVDAESGVTVDVTVDNEENREATDKSLALGPHTLTMVYSKEGHATKEFEEKIYVQGVLSEPEIQSTNGTFDSGAGDAKNAPQIWKFSYLTDDSLKCKIKVGNTGNTVVVYSTATGSRVSLSKPTEGFGLGYDTVIPLEIVQTREYCKSLTTTKYVQGKIKPITLTYKNAKNGGEGYAGVYVKRLGADDFDLLGDILAYRVVDGKFIDEQRVWSYGEDKYGITSEKWDHLNTDTTGHTVQYTLESPNDELALKLVELRRRKHDDEGKISGQATRTLADIKKGDGLYFTNGTEKTGWTLYTGKVGDYAEVFIRFVTSD